MKKIIFIIGVFLVIVAMVELFSNINFVKQTVASEVVHNQKAYKKASLVAKAMIDNGCYSDWFPSEKNTQRVVELIDGTDSN